MELRVRRELAGVGVGVGVGVRSGRVLSFNTSPFGILRVLQAMLSMPLAGNPVCSSPPTVGPP